MEDPLRERRVAPSSLHKMAPWERAWGPGGLQPGPWGSLSRPPSRIASGVTGRGWLWSAPTRPSGVPGPGTLVGFLGFFQTGTQISSRWGLGSSASLQPAWPGCASGGDPLVPSVGGGKARAGRLRCEQVNKQTNASRSLKL